MDKAPSPTMIEAFDHAKAAGGELVRFQGGYWAHRNASRHPHNGVPITHFGTNTIHGLVLRGLAEYSEHRKGRNGRFPVAIRIIETAST